jgi:hypothetical protein
MEETPFNQSNSVDTKVIFVINRDTGEFALFNNNFILDFQSNTVFLIRNDILIPVCTGHRDNNNWYFKGLGIIRSHEDPFVAAFKVLFYIFKR